MAADIAVMKRPRRAFSLSLASGPVHVPRVFAPTGPLVSIPTFRPMPRLGPPLRHCNVGDAVTYYGGNSYVRGSGPATGHTWRVYNYGVATDGNYLADRGALVTSGTGTTFTFTPAAGGTYAVELHLTGATEGNGVTAPLGFGVRFLKAFAAGGYDLEGVPEIAGPNGSLDDGGVTLDLAYRRPDNRNGRQTVQHLARVCVNHRLYYGTNTGPLEHYTWQPEEFYQEVLFSGLISGSSIREDPRTHEVSYQLQGAHLALTQCQVPLRQMVSDEDPDDPYTIWVPPAFFDQALWNLLMAAAPTEIPGWVYTVTDLKASDPLLLVLQMTNIPDFFDVIVNQDDTDVIGSTEASAGSVLDWLRAMQSGRFGRLYTDRKSYVFCATDDDLKPNAFRPSPFLTLDGDLYRDIRVTHAAPTVGQVYVETGDVLRESEVEVKVNPNSALEAAILQKVLPTRVQAIYPFPAANGARRSYTAARFYDEPTLGEMAARLYTRDNARFPEIVLELGMFPHLDLGQPVLVAFVPRSDEAAVAWSPTPLRAYVTGYSNRAALDGTDWQTTVTLREATLP